MTLRICQIVSVPLPPEEGIGNWIFPVCKILKKRNHDISIITRTPNKPSIEYVEGIKIFKSKFIPIYPFHVSIHKKYVEKILDSNLKEYDIIHLHSPLVPAIQSKKSVVVSTMHTTTIGSARRTELVDYMSLLIKMHSYTFSSLIERHIIKHSKLIMTTCRPIRDEIHSYGCPYDKIHVVYNGVETDKYVPSKNVTNKKYILYVGRLVYRKGLFDLINSSVSILKEHDDLEYIIVGKGPLLSQLYDLSKKLGVQHKINFTGYVSEKRLISLYQNAATTVVPSHYEGTTGVLLQAMSAGSPTIATNVGGHPDVIDNGLNGFLIPPKSPGSITKALDIVLSDNKNEKKVRKNARKRIVEHFSCEILSDRIYECYLKALEEE